MKRVVGVIFIITICVSASGCARIFNPYKSEWSCPSPYLGKCEDVQDAYKESVSGQDDKNAQAFRDKVNSEKKVAKKGSDDDVTGCTTCGGGSSSGTGRGFTPSSCNNECSKNRTSKSCQECLSSLPKPSEEEIYKEQLYREMTSLIEQPRTPMLKQPEVLRVLVLGYTGDENEFFSHRYMYLIVSDPRWILDPVQEVR